MSKTPPFDSGPPLPSTPLPAGEFQFLADCMLGRLARWLRILGYDTLYFRQIPDRDLAETHRRSGRILLTRDTGLLRVRDLGPHLGISHDHWRAQLHQVIDACSLPVSPERVFTRCTRCNQPLRDVVLPEVQGRIPEFVAATQRGFRDCAFCGRIYWPGSHRQRVLELLGPFVAGTGEPGDD